MGIQSRNVIFFWKELESLEIWNSRNRTKYEVHHQESGSNKKLCDGLGACLWKL